jgi:hypothetical protein
MNPSCIARLTSGFENLFTESIGIYEGLINIVTSVVLVLHKEETPVMYAAHPALVRC